MPGGGTLGITPKALRHCPLWVISRHNDPFTSCPLYPRQRTFVGAGGMSEKCHKRTCTKSSARSVHVHGVAWLPALVGGGFGRAVEAEITSLPRCRLAPTSYRTAAFRGRRTGTAPQTRHRSWWAPSSIPSPPAPWGLSRGSPTRRPSSL